METAVIEGKKSLKNLESKCQKRHEHSDQTAKH